MVIHEVMLDIFRILESCGSEGMNLVYIHKNRERFSYSDDRLAEFNEEKAMEFVKIRLESQADL